MGRGLSDLQKNVLKSCLQVEIKHMHTLFRPRLQKLNDNLPMAEVVALAGAGERTATAEVVATKTVHRLIERGLLIGDTCDHYPSNKHVKLSREGEAKARELYPTLSIKLDRVIAAAEARLPAFEAAARAEAHEQYELPAEQIAVLEARAHKAMLKLS